MLLPAPVSGKSILMDALALLLGEKASADIIRTGAEKAVISAVFESEGATQSAIESVLEENGLDESDDASLILRREVATGGKSRVFINNQPATVSVLRQLAPHLATIHAQSETLAAFDGPARLSLIDAFAAIATESVAEAYARWREIRSRIEDLEKGEQDKLRLLDLWKFQQKEISAARIHAGEDDSLAAEKLVLANAERIYNAAMNAFDLLYEGNHSTASTLRAAQKQIEELSRYEPKFQDAFAAIDTARINVEDVGATLRDYAGGIQASPERLAAIEDRLALLDGLKRKYGPGLDQVSEFGATVERNLSEVENKDEILRHLRTDLAKAAEDFLREANVVSRNRRAAAAKLQKRVESEVNDLAMNARFQIEFTGSAQESDWTASGTDQVAYMIATNPGEPLRRLEHVASGGELSRVMLALKASVEGGAESKKQDLSRASSSAKVAGSRAASQRTLVFDEIDIGIGGRAAEAVGRKLKALAARNQVLCVTHLAQIATFADHHYVIEKKQSQGRTRTSIRSLTGPERTEEVARMLSGAQLTDASRKHAEQMIKTNA